jgi:DNA repair exonuclease SbcCD nuclease subunit
MRFIALADHHWKDGDRLEECVRVHDFVADLVEREEPSAVLSAGDLYDSLSTPTERSLVSAWCRRIADVCPLFIARGNHDRQRDLEILSRLAVRTEICVQEGALAYTYGVNLGLVAWPSRSSLAAWVGKPASTLELDEHARIQIRNVLSGLFRDAQPGRPKVLVMHAQVEGSALSTGQPLIGKPLTVSLEDLAHAGADVAVLGHIHKPQHWNYRGVDYIYTGSPFRTAFGELEEKSVLLIDIDDDDGRIHWERIPTPARPMVHWEATWHQESADFLSEAMWMPSELLQAEVRFRFHVLSDQRASAKAKAQEIRTRMLAEGAYSVSLDEVITTPTRARTPEVSTATTLEGKCEALWRARGIEMPDERRARLMAKLSTLQESP